MMEADSMSRRGEGPGTDVDYSRKSGKSLAPKVDGNGTIAY